MKLRTLDEIVRDYMETKSIAWELVDVINKQGKPNNTVLYRGDCMYESNIVIGNKFRLWNWVASFSRDYKVAEKFANVENAPDWYYDEYEWCNDSYDYPFSKHINNKEKLVPVIIAIEPSRYVKQLCTDEFSNKFRESEHIVSVEYIEFEIVDIKDNVLKCNVLPLTPKTSRMNLF